MEKTQERTAGYPVHPMFVERRSLRAMSGENLPEASLMTLFEAARWAPSSLNAQPWKFIHVRRGTPEFDAAKDLLTGANPSWAGKASHLVLMASRMRKEDGTPVGAHSFDAGAAWMSLALQGQLNGLVVHAMGGFDRQRAIGLFNVPEDWKPEVMIAIGLPGDPAELPEKLREREAVPSPRRALAEIVHEGKWG